MILTNPSPPLNDPGQPEIQQLIGASLLAELCQNFRRATGWPLDARDVEGRSLAGIDPATLVAAHEIPLAGRLYALGSLVLGTSGSACPPADFPAARALAESIARIVQRLAGCSLAIDRQREELVSLLEDTDRLSRDLSTASKIQARSLPMRAAHHESYELAAWSQASQELGGDLYDFIPIGGDNLGIAIGDAIGKSIPAAMLMANVRAGLRAHVANVFRVSDILDRLNQTLFQDTQGEWFVTLFYGVLDWRNRQLTYSNAGHNAPLLCHNREIHPLQEGGMILGIAPDVRYREGSLLLVPGDALVFYTDGITEAMNRAQELFSSHRLRCLIRGHAHEPAAAILDHIRSAVTSFAGPVQQDDMTIIVLKMK